MAETVVKWFLVVAICAGVIFGVVHGYELWRNAKVAEGDKAGAARVQASWDADVRLRDRQKLEAVQTAVTLERKIAAQAVQGERDAREKAERAATLARADAVKSRSSAGGLRDNVAALDGSARALGVPDAASCPGRFAEQRDAAVRARDLLSACSTEYRDMAESTDSAFGGAVLKLDTAIGYIKAVAPK